MGTIVCQTCGSIIEHFESNQVKTLYAICDCEGCLRQNQEERS
ncbi:MAG TPA: GapA-binding peptide SR1P [Brevibacillus sp.]|nr:GapA-binding peptide SR1P [Brevibacillus sp.]